MKRTASRRSPGAGRRPRRPAPVAGRAGVRKALAEPELSRFGLRVAQGPGYHGGLVTTEPSSPKFTGYPRVAIVGRPNVGKSTLLNRMHGSRVSIVEPTAGVTRDRISVPARLPTSGGLRNIEVIDTGGIGIVDRDDLGPHVERQVQAAMGAADVVLFMVDARDGLTPLDLEVARRLRGMPQPVILVVNKTEGQEQQWVVDEFRRLGIEEGPFAISAQNGTGLHPLYDRLAELLPAEADGPNVFDRDAGPPPKIAIVGRRNAGKSTLVNALAGEERMIVSEIPGTTRDSVDVVFERDGKSFVAIDTAGIRRRTRLADGIEFYSDARSKKAIRRADVVFLMIDATQELGAIDKRLARYVIDHYKPVVIVANKWDAMPVPDKRGMERYLRDELPGLAFAPIVFASAIQARGLDELLSTSESLWEQSRRRVGTGELNRVLRRALEGNVPSSRARFARLLYATQASSAPPTIVLFFKNKKIVGKELVRYLQNRLRNELGFPNIPLQIAIRDRESMKAEEA